MARKLTGRDGKTVTIPDGGRGVQGSDGHMVAKRRDAGEPTREIARSYNVSHSTISRLVV